MSLSHLRAALSFKKTDDQKPTVPVSPNPQYSPSTPRTSTPRRSSITGRNSVLPIGTLSLGYHGGSWTHRHAGSRRASVKSNMSIRRVNRLPQPGIQGTRSVSSNESVDPLSSHYSGFFYDDDEEGRNGSSVFTPHASRQPVIKRWVQSSQVFHPT